MVEVRGTYPLGEPLRAVVQQDRGPKRAFVRGVYSTIARNRRILRGHHPG